MKICAQRDQMKQSEVQVTLEDFPAQKKNHCASLAQGVPLALMQTAGKLKTQP